MRAYAEEGLSIVEVLPDPPNKFYNIIDKGWFVILPLIVIVLFFHKYLPDSVAIFISIFLVVYIFLYLLYVQIGNLFRSENIAYNIIGKIHFYNDFVEIMNMRIDFSELRSIEITSYDYEGRRSSSNTLYNPIYSLGINNFLIVYFKDGTVDKYQFKLLNEIHMFYFRKELIHYYKLGLIRELNLHDILGNHSFESKSDFRKHNPKYNNYPS
ncbi:hypothetical protein H1R17_01695 [Flavobacterium sp. xlx-214]|uniref:hypothetical protein n=1 Tax=unclassified Flavobacterium TaxID=196869 RepID=UPI0013D78829|nr:MULTISPECIES: hypothetical protein [unclassified Flavobacterium]MBA5792735.1 hypothetical protein [Flavobacterium sp. xlx-221]QMI83872.1 hypothetical protein H1R17_01695 [Flavobacterium sp. xlx-214]